MVTALRMPDSELTRRARLLLARHRRHLDVPVAPPTDILAKVRKVAVLLREQYHASRVVLFGSLVQGGRWWSPSSDIDLAVQGIEGFEYWQACASIEGVIPGRSIDLVDLDMATDSLRLAIDRYGVDL